MNNDRSLKHWIISDQFGPQDAKNL